MSTKAPGTANEHQWITIASDSVTLQILARPGRTQAGPLRIDPRGLVVALHSPPEKGRANDELIDLLARALKLPRANVTLVRGATSRFKTVRIATVRPCDVATAIGALAPGAQQV
jgi:uncharacterized protein (TIGR00251 family)